MQHNNTNYTINHFVLIFNIKTKINKNKLVNKTEHNAIVCEHNFQRNKCRQTIQTTRFNIFHLSLTEKTKTNKIY